MKHQTESQDSLIVVLLFIVVVMMAYMIFVQPPARVSDLNTATAPGSAPAGGMPQPASPVPQAGTPVSQAGTPVPSASRLPQGAIPGRMGPLHLRELLSGIVALERSGSLKLSQEQARTLVPLLKQYRDVHGAIPATRNLIIDQLTPKQKAYLENVVSSGPPSPDPRHSAEELLNAAVERVLKAIETR